MGNPFQFSDQTINYDTAVASSKIQPLREALDVSAFDEMDVLLEIAALKGSGSPTTFQVSVITGMQTQTESGWVIAGTFSNHTASGAEKLYVTGLLQYVRWQITSTDFDTASFTLTGVLRRRGM